MFYKQYMTNYIGIGDTITIAIMDRDMTGFKNDSKEDGEFILAHTKNFIIVPREEYENPYNHLENGLFKGIIPPELILQEINEWEIIQNKTLEELKNIGNDRIMNKWNDDFFYELKYKDKMDLKQVLKLLKNYNRLRILENLEPWNIEKEYKDYLVKYWGDYKLD